MIGNRYSYWIEEYERCGCSEDYSVKADLLGYCPTHGENWVNRYFMRLNKKTGKYRIASHYSRSST